MVGIALLVILPTVFMTTTAATFLFLWGLGGYYIVKWFNENSSPASKGDTIGDKLNNLSGGRVGFLTNGARKREVGEFDGLGENGGIKEEAQREVEGGVEGVKQRVGKGKGGGEE
jgi:hypothetical protein